MMKYLFILSRADKWLSAGLVVFGLISFVSPVLAAVEPITITPSFGFASLSQAINTLLNFLFFGGALACFFYIVLGAFKYLSAGDNSNGVSAARTTITNAIIGLVLLGLVFVIFQIVIRVVPGLNNFFQISGSSSTPSPTGLPDLNPSGPPTNQCAPFCPN